MHLVHYMHKLFKLVNLLQQKSFLNMSRLDIDIIVEEKFFYILIM